MLSNKLSNYQIILASGSPRRQRFFKELDIDFVIKVKSINEVYPPNLKKSEITDYLSKLKASAFKNISENEIVITSDTIVWFNGKAIEKPRNKKEAFKMPLLYLFYFCLCVMKETFHFTEKRFIL